jgi:hypothetical protein
MVSTLEIRDQFAHTDADKRVPRGADKRVLRRDDLTALPNIMFWEDEKVEEVMLGMHAGGLDLLIATNKRLVFVEAPEHDEEFQPQKQKILVG